MDIDIVARVRAIELRFWKKVDRRSDDECWEWQGSYRGGYGQVRIANKPPKEKLGAHQVAYVLANGFLPPAVRHKCNNPPCCNAKHLTAGTQADNVRDAVSAKRHAHGAKNARAKLTEAQVKAVKSTSRVVSDKELADRLGVDKSTIWLIRSGKTWQSVS